eukprot:208352_1
MATTLCLKTCTAIGRYYAALGRPYDNLFSSYCEEMGLDEDDEHVIDEMVNPFDECLLVEFDEDFPLPNNRTKIEFIYLLIKKCMSNPDITFSKLQIDVSLPEEKAQQIADTVYKKQT